MTWRTVAPSQSTSLRPSAVVRPTGSLTWATGTASDLRRFLVHLVDLEIHGEDVGVLAEGDALRVAVAQVALKRDHAIRMLVDHVVGAGFVAVAAVGALGLVHDQDEALHRVADLLLAVESPARRDGDLLGHNRAGGAGVLALG